MLNSTPSPPCIAIVGGGLAGLALSIGLTRHGITHKIYEAAPAFAEIGAGIAMGPTAVTALALIDPRLRECYERCATYGEDPDLQDTFFLYRNGKADDEKKRFGEVISQAKAHGATASGKSTAHRAQMLTEFIKFVPEGVAEFHKRVVSLKQDEDGITISFGDGTSARASAVLGCDGIKSFCRASVLGKENPQVKPKFMGEHAYRIILERRKADEILTHAIAGIPAVYCSPGRYIVTYPIDHGRLLNVVAVNRNRNSEWEHDEWIVPTSREQMMEEFKDCGEPIKKLLAEIKAPQRWALFDAPPADTYFRGRICILGDAAHASGPHQGSGAAMAFEDAYILSGLLGRARSVENVNQVFRAFDAVRRIRTQHMCTTSREAGALLAMAHKDVGEDWIKFDRNISVRHDWIFKEDLSKELDLACSLLRYYVDQSGGNVF